MDERVKHTRVHIVHHIAKQTEETTLGENARTILQGQRKCAQIKGMYHNRRAHSTQRAADGAKFCEPMLTCAMTCAVRAQIDFYRIRQTA